MVEGDATSYHWEFGPDAGTLGPDGNPLTLPLRVTKAMRIVYKYQRQLKA